MDSFTHHAYIIFGDKEKNFENVLGTLGGRVHPDTEVFVFDKLQIDDARSIKEKSFQMPVAREHRFFIVSFNEINMQAQNALLKVFEDGPAYTKFILLTEGRAGLLDTFMSRFEVKEGEKVEEKRSFALSAKTGSEIIASAQKLAEEISKNKKTKKDMQDFLLELASCLRQKNQTEKYGAVLHLLSYAKDPSASSKMLLETAAIIAA